jgi:hypothetical protein
MSKAEQDLRFEASRDVLLHLLTKRVISGAQFDEFEKFFANRYSQSLEPTTSETLAKEDSAEQTQ